MAPRIFQTWPGWYRTPVCRSMTAAAEQQRRLEAALF
jgi:hypothetical protein